VASGLNGPEARRIITQTQEDIVKNFREYYQECLEAEKPKFIRVMNAVPADQAGYRPHPRSTAAGDLVWLLASELQDACELIDRGEVSYIARPAPTVPESIAVYERNVEALQKRVATLDDARWDRKVRFLVDGHVAWETSLGDMLFGFLFDAIHHRGQLSTYLRPMGAKVPSIYGPSADDPGM
jgi:uncharacterized damage-inducible protein DinB